MPKDIIAEQHAQRTAAADFDREATAQALNELMRDQPDAIRKWPTAYTEKWLLNRANEIRANTPNAPQAPGTLFNFNNPSAAVVPLATRAANTVLQGAHIGPNGDPTDAFDALDLDFVKEIATGNVPRGDNLADTLMNWGPGLAAVAAQRVGGPVTTYAKPFAAALGTAFTTGAAAPFLRQAQALRDSGYSVPQSLSGAAERVGVRQMLWEAVLNTGMEAGASAPTLLPSALAEKTMRSVGVGSDFLNQWVDDAAKYSIDMSLKDVSTSEIVRRLGQSVGRFPHMNTAFKESAEKTGGQIQDAFADVMTGLVPTIAEINQKGTLEQSARATRIALRVFTNAEKAANFALEKHSKLYGNFYREAAATGTLVRPVNGEIAAAAEREQLRAAIKKLSQKKTGILDAQGNPITRDILTERTPRGDLARADKALEDLLDSPDRLPSVKDFVGTIHRLQAVVDEVGSDSQAGKHLIAVLTAMRTDFETNLVGPESVKRLKKKADRYYKESVELLSGSTGNLLRQIDVEYGRKKLDVDPFSLKRTSLGSRTGNSNPLEVVNDLFSENDVNVVNDLHRLLTRGQVGQSGEKAFREAYGLYLSNTIDRLTAPAVESGIRVTNTKALRKELGLDHPKSSAFYATARAFQLSGINVLDFMKMLDISDQVFKYGVPDVSQLMTRRVMLSGLTGGANTFMPVRLFGTNAQSTLPSQILDRIASTAVVYYLGKKNIKKLTDPAILRSYMEIINPNAPSHIRTRAARRLLALDVAFGTWDDVLGADPEGPRSVTLSPQEAAGVAAGVR